MQNCLELVMIFDDGFMNVPNPYEDGVLEDDDVGADLWFRTIRILRAERQVTGGLTVFEKMEMPQGSLIPFFCGAHKFRLANGREVFGVLMEYVDSPSLDSGVTSKWLEEHWRQSTTNIRQSLSHPKRRHLITA